MSMIGNLKQISPSQLEATKKNPSLVKSLISPGEGENGEELCLDKAWHGIHFLLTGKSEGGDPPLANAIMGGKEIGDDLGYGPARYLTPEEVKQAAQALSEISKENLEKKFDLEAMKKADIYPGPWKDRKAELDYLLFSFDELVDYYQEAAEKQNAILLYIT